MMKIPEMIIANKLEGKENPTIPDILTKLEEDGITKDTSSNIVGKKDYLFEVIEKLGEYQVNYI